MTSDPSQTPPVQTAGAETLAGPAVQGRPPTVGASQPGRPGLLVLGLVFCLWAFWGTRPFPVAYDVSFHLRFAADFFQSVREEPGWPDWDARPYDGRGTPAFRFYAPLPYAVAAGFQAVGLAAPSAVQATITVFALLAAWGARRWLRALGRPELGDPAAFVMLASPTLAVHLHWMFFFQNVCAILVLPHVLAAVAESDAQPVTGVRRGAVAYAVMAVTHLPATMMAGYAIALYGVIAGLGRRTLGPVIRCMAIAGFGLLLAAPYIVPAMTGLDSLNFSRLEAKVPWLRTDFFGDPLTPEVAKPDEPILWDGVRQVFAYCLVAGLLAAVGGVALSLGRPGFAALAGYGAVGIVLLGATFRISVGLWPHMPGWRVLQFPWRWLFPAQVLMLPWMAALLEAATRPRWRPAWLILLVPWLGLTLTIQMFAKPLPIEDLPKVMNLAFYYPWEYVPGACPCAATLAPRAGEIHRLHLASGAGVLQVTRRTANTVAFTVEVATSSWAAVHINTHADPGWRFRCNDIVLPIEAEPLCGTMRVSVPPGVAHCVLDRPMPRARLAGWGLMLLAVLVLVLAGRFAADRRDGPVV